MASVPVPTLLAREVGRAVRDRFVRRAALPAHIDDLDAATLSGIIGQEVRAVRVLDGTSGTTDRRIVALEGEGPASAFVKMAPRAPMARFFGNLVGLGPNELGFYRELRGDLAIEAPAVHGSAFDPRTGRYLLVLEDLAARGVRFTGVAEPLTVGELRAVLDTLAALHAPLWDSDRLTEPNGDLAWIPRLRDDPFLGLVTRVIRSRGRKLQGRRPDLVPPAAPAILSGYPTIARELDRGPTTVLHGDPHPGNAYLRDGRAGLFDWQVVRRGNALRDVTYAVVLGLDPETRRAHEHSLLDHYRSRLVAHGGPSLERDDVVVDHRAMSAYPYVAAGFTVALGGLQRDDVAIAGLARAAVAVDDLDPLDAIAVRRDREIRRPQPPRAQMS